MITRYPSRFNANTFNQTNNKKKFEYKWIIILCEASFILGIKETSMNSHLFKGS